MKQWLHDFLRHPWVDCKEAADGADGRAECGKRGTSWGPSRYRYRKSATAVRRVYGRPHRTAVFDFRFRARYEPQLVPESMCKYVF